LEGKVSERKNQWRWEEDGMKVVRSVARTAPGCHEGCGVLLYVRDGKLVKVEGDPEFFLWSFTYCAVYLLKAPCAKKTKTEVLFMPELLTKKPLRK